MRIWSVWCFVWLAAGLGAVAQQPATPQQPPAVQAAPIERRDPALEVAANLVGRALILRCFCAENNLAFDAAGQPGQTVKRTDWTLAGVNVLKAERKATGTIELEGVRVAMRYAPDRAEFDRHAMNDEKVKILVADDGTAAGMARTLDRVFSVGLDLRLQRAMPAYWQHYFNPKAAWPKDGLEGQTIVATKAAGAPAGFTEPKQIHNSEPSYTAEATHDRVQGLVTLLVVVDAEGRPQRVAVAQPLGYGLDARTVEAVEKYKFQPAMAGDKAVASYVEVRQQFTIAPQPH